MHNLFQYSESRPPLTWLTRCWNGGADGSRRSRSVCNANSVRAFQGGWYDCTSIGFIPRGLSWRTGLDATMGIPCMLPYPNFLPSCNSHVTQISQSGVSLSKISDIPKIQKQPYSCAFAYNILDFYSWAISYIRTSLLTHLEHHNLFTWGLRTNTVSQRHII
jgi:hypothetical protein